MLEIKNNFSAFLHLHTTQNEAVVADSQNALKEAMTWTSDQLLAPYRKALKYEVAADHESAPWCEMAQRRLASLNRDEDIERLKMISVYKEESHPFEDTRVGWTVENNTATFNVSGHNKYYGATDLSEQCVKPASELGCKMASANRVAKVLNVTKDFFDDKARCITVNAYAEETAHGFLSETDAGKDALARYIKRGRPIRFLKDFQPPGSIGPLWAKNSMTIKDSKDGTVLEVASLALGPQGLRSPIFPGTFYCKLISPARIIDYIFTDSLKAKSGCLNTN